jgi:hypothetical protein
LSALALPLLSGCILGGVQPGQFQFVTIVEKTEPGEGGWREACLHALVENMTTRDSFVCTIGVGMPIQNKQNGFITTWAAQSIAAECANKASELAILPAPATAPSALVCQGFRDQYSALLDKAVRGSRVTGMCHRKTTPVRIGF